MASIDLPGTGEQESTGSGESRFESPDGQKSLLERRIPRHDDLSGIGDWMVGHVPSFRHIDTSSLNPSGSGSSEKGVTCGALTVWTPQLTLADPQPQTPIKSPQCSKRRTCMCPKFTDSGPELRRPTENAPSFFSSSGTGSTSNRSPSNPSSWPPAAHCGWPHLRWWPPWRVSRRSGARRRHRSEASLARHRTARPRRSEPRR